MNKPTKYSITPNKANFEWDIETGEFSVFGIPSALFWLNPSLYRLLTPLVTEIGVDLFRLIVANSSREGTDEDYHSMLSSFGDNFKDGFHGWADCVSSCGWGKFSLIAFDEKKGTATVEVRNPWELQMQSAAQDHSGPWGCPFLMGKISGIFSHAFGRNCWADESFAYDGTQKTLTLSVYISERTIEKELQKLREQRESNREVHLREQIELKTKELQRAERELKDYSRSLEDKVKIRTRELETATHKANEASAAKSQFLANMSHEIRTPMNGILGTLEILCEADLSNSQMELAKTSLDCSRSLLAILNDILDFSKIEAGKIEIEKKYFSYRALCTRIVDYLNPKAELNELALFLDIDPTMPEIICSDETKLQQVFNNLISNSLKFTKPGGGIVIGARKEWLSSGAPLARFFVIDSGIGVKLDKQDAIFEVFSQADNTISREYGGSGLGLSIAKQLVDWLGGSLEIRSKVNVGTCFTFALPIPHETQLQPGDLTHKDEKAIPTPTFGLKVLLAEDNRVNQKVMQHILEKSGCEVFIAEDGRQAVDAWSDQSFDVILMDVQMPVMSGLEAISAIRGSSLEKSKIPIIAVTAHAMVEDREACLHAGADNHITKPINRKILHETLASICKMKFPA